MRPQFQGKAPGQQRNRGFGRGVEGRACHGRAVRGNGREVHDAPETALLHALRDGARGDDDTVHIDAIHPLHARVVEVAKIAALHDSGVVDQDIDRSQFSFESFDHGAYLKRHRDVCAER